VMHSENFRVNSSAISDNEIQLKVSW